MGIHGEYYSSLYVERILNGEADEALKRLQLMLGDLQVLGKLGSKRKYIVYYSSFHVPFHSPYITPILPI